MLRLHVVFNKRKQTTDNGVLQCKLIYKYIYNNNIPY